jgi:integrase
MARGERPPATKAEAARWRDRLRIEIRSGQFGADVPAGGLTFGDVVKNYLSDYVYTPTRKPDAAETFEVHCRILLRTTIPGPRGVRVALKDKPIGEITRADVEAIRSERRRAFTEAASDASGGRHASDRPTVRRPGTKGGEVGLNRLLARLRHIFSWSIQRGYITASPFRLNGQTVIHLESKAEGARQRRLQPGEEQRLLDAAPALMRALIIAALSTGCRIGELLGLRWSDVRRHEQGEPTAIVLPAHRTKTNRPRVLPVGIRLRAVLAMRQTDPAGAPLPGSAFVFGNEVGEQTSKATLRAMWDATRAAAGIEDLHVHDLRREFASRLLESSAGLHDVMTYLGHSNVTTTSRYLESTPVRLERALAQMEQRAGLSETDSHTARTEASESAVRVDREVRVTH